MDFDPVINRELRPGWVDEIARDLDLDGIGIPLVSRRLGGQVIVVDAQHRIKALLLRGFGDYNLDCEVFEDLSVQEEAALFVLRNHTRRLSHIDTFLKRVLSGDAVAVAINNVVHACGLVVHKQVAEGHITASKALERLYLGDRLVGRKDNAKALADTLGTLVATFGRGSAGLEGDLILGLGLVFLREDGRVDKKTMAEKLSKVPGGPSGLIGKARGAREMHSKTMPHAMAGVIVNAYNKGRRNKKTQLQTWLG